MTFTEAILVLLTLALLIPLSVEIFRVVIGGGLVALRGNIPTVPSRFDHLANGQAIRTHLRRCLVLILGLALISIAQWLAR